MLSERINYLESTLYDYSVVGPRIMREAFGDYPEKISSKLVTLVDGSQTEITDLERAKFITAMFKTSDSYMFKSEVTRAGVDLENIPRIILNEDMNPLISAMLDHPERFRMQLGIIMSQIDFRQLPDNLKAKMNPHNSGLHITLKSYHFDWFLCAGAEQNLVKALKDRAVMIIGDGDLLLKLKEKLSALCLRDTVTSEGKMLMRGNWYSFTDDRTKFQIQDAFDRGQKKIDLERSSCALMRPIQSKSVSDVETIIKNAEEFVCTILDTYPYKTQ